MKEIARLNINVLDDKTWDYYKTHYDFQTVTNKTDYAVPVLRSTILELEAIQNNPSESIPFNKGMKADEVGKYPWLSYAEGFMQTYNSPFPVPYIDTHDTREQFIKKHTAINPPQVVVNFSRKNGTTYIEYPKDVAFKYGQTIALYFMAWEIVIENFEFFKDKITLPPSDNHLIIEEQRLKTFYHAHHDLWEYIEFTDFLNCWRKTPIWKLKIPKYNPNDPENKTSREGAKMKKFCQCVGKELEPHKINTLCPNFNKWIKPFINTYGTLKSLAK